MGEKVTENGRRLLISATRQNKIIEDIMNKIYKETNLSGEVKYRIVTEDGTEFYGKPWYEKKTDKWWVKLGDDNPTGRKYIAVKDIIDNNDELEFESKTPMAKGTMNIGDRGWKSRLEPDELKELEEAEKTIERLKALALSRPKKELTEEEKLQKQIDALLRKQKELLEKKAK